MDSYLFYFRIYGEHTFHLFLLTLLLCLHYPKREKLPLRLVCSLLLSLLSVALAALLHSLQASLGFGGYYGTILTSFIGYLIPILSLFFSFSLCLLRSEKLILFNLCTAFAIRQIGEELCALSAFVIPSLEIGTEAFSNYRYLLLVLTSFLSYFIVIRKVNVKTKSTEVNDKALIVSIVGVLACILFSQVQYQHITEHDALNRIGEASQILIDLFIFILRLGILERNILIDESFLLQQSWVEKEKQLKLFKENLDDINIKYHDLKKILSTIKEQSGIVPKELVDELEHSVAVHESYVDTGNTTLDVILTQYTIKSQANSIRFSCIADGKCVSFLSPTDLIALISNLLDNAFEAVLPLAENERSVGFILQETRGVVTLHTENNYGSEIVLEKGEILSSKADKRYHGFGMKSIKRIVEKYGGAFSVDTEHHVFKVNILFHL